MYLAELVIHLCSLHPPKPFTIDNLPRITTGLQTLVIPPYRLVAKLERKNIQHFRRRHEQTIFAM